MIFGQACLLLALIVAVCGSCAAIVGARRTDSRWIASSRRRVHAPAGLVAAAFATIELAYARDDFAYALVAGNTSTTVSAFYRLTAVWSSHARPRAVPELRRRRLA